jgi:hypothetical protein
MTYSSQPDPEIPEEIDECPLELAMTAEELFLYSFVRRIDYPFEEVIGLDLPPDLMALLGKFLVAHEEVITELRTRACQRLAGGFEPFAPKG